VPALPDQGAVHDGRLPRITRWEHEEVLEAMQKTPGEDARGRTHPPADRRACLWHLESWMGATHFLMKRLPNVKTEMSLHVLAYNLKRAMQIFGVVPLMKAMRA